MSRHVIIDGVRYVPAADTTAQPNESPGDYCRRVRTAMGLSMAQLADFAQVDLHTIADFEKRSRHTRVSSVVRIAQALNLSLDRMFGLPAAGGAP